MLGDSQKLNAEELLILINKYTNLDDVWVSGNINKSIRNKLISLDRELGKYIDITELDYTKNISTSSTGVKILSKDIIYKLGYTQNTIFIYEAEVLVGKIYNYTNWNNPHGPYSNEELATCVVGEILNHYKSKYDINELIDILDINIDKFIRLSLKCHEWCERNYWKK